MAINILDFLRGATAVAKNAAVKGLTTASAALKKSTPTPQPVSTLPLGSRALSQFEQPGMTTKVAPTAYGSQELRAPTSQESDRITVNSFFNQPTVSGGFQALNQLTGKLGSAALQKANLNQNPTTPEQIRSNLSLSTLPARLVGELIPGSAKVAETATRPVLESGEKALKFANASDEYKTKNTLEGLAAAGNTAYEAAKLVGLGGKAPALLQNIAKPAFYSNLSQLLPEEQRSAVRPLLEAYGVVSSPDKVMAALNVAAGRATDPLTNYVNESNLSQPVKDLANLGINLGENFVAYKGAKSFAPSEAGIKAGYKAYQAGAPFMDVMDTALKARDEMAKANKPVAIGPTVGEVLGYKSPEQKAIPASKVKKIVPQEFKAEKLQLGEEGTVRMKQLQEQLKLNKRQVRSFEDMAELAKRFDDDTDALLSSNKRITDAEVVALKNLIAQDSDFIAKNQGDAGEATQMKVEQANARIQKAIKRLIPAGTEAGRAVVAFKLLANKSMDPAAWQLRAQKVKGDKALTDIEIKNIQDLAAANDRTGLALYVANLRQPTIAEKFGTLWKAGLLTSPTTHIANVTSNTAMGLLKVPEKLIATGLDKAASLVTGKRTTTFSPGAMLKGYGQGAVKAYDYLKTGIDPDALDKIDVKVNPLKNKLLRGYTDAVFRSLGAEDIVFKGGPYAESIASQAKVIGMNEGLRGKGLADRVKELVAVPTDEMLLQAKKDAQEATFQQDNLLASTVSRAKNSYMTSDNLAKQVIGTAADMIIPFTKTPANVAIETLRRTPAGIVESLAKQIKAQTRSQKDLVEGLSKGITGTGMIALGSLLFRNGLTTGLPPEDQSERDRWYAEGKQANAIKIGGEWYGLNRISPLGNLLSLGSEIERLRQTGLKGGELYAAAGLTGVKGIKDQTFLSGLSDLLDAIDDPDRNLKKVTGNLVSSVIPSVVSRVARGLDPTMRKPDTVGDYFQSKVPGLTENVAPKIDIFGNEVTRGGGLVKSLFDPFNTTKVNNDPVLKEIQQVKADIGLPSNRMYNTTLDGNEYAAFQEIQGKVLHDVLDEIINGSQYKNLKDFEKTEMLEEAAQTVKDEVKAVAFPTIMIKRYQLPEDTNAELLTELINETHALPDFKKMSFEDQRGVILDVLSSLR